MRKRTRPESRIWLLPFVLCIDFLAPVTVQGQERPRLSVALDAGPAPFVGQGVGLRVTAAGFDGPPALVAPRVQGAEVLASGDDGTSYKFLLIPERAGVIRIPPFVAAGGVASAPIEVRGRAQPGGGPPTSLGGVGAVTVVAELSADAVRLGDSAEYRLTLGGPGAPGSTRRPTIRWPSGLDARPIAAPGPEADPPSRRYRWAIRPSRPGRLVVPATAVSVLDPSTGRYVTSVSRSVRLDVVDRPPAELADDPREPAIEPRSPWARVIWVGAAAVGLSGVVAWILRRRRPARGRLARRLSRSLPDSAGPEEAARKVIEALAAYLGRDVGVLTPVEARAALGARGERLVAACDRVRYSGRVVDADALLADARALLAERARGEHRGSVDRGGAGG